MILFNFELLITMSMSKQHDIKFVIIIKVSTSNIKLVLIYIIFKNDILNKKRFNLIDKLIFKSQYFDVFLIRIRFSTLISMCRVRLTLIFSTCNMLA